MSRSQAERYVRRGEAVMIGATIHLLSPTEIRHQQHIERIIRSERHASDVYVAGAFAIAVIDRWTFPHTIWMHKPGEVLP